MADLGPLPEGLARLHAELFDAEDPKSVTALAKALASAEPRGPLPDPMPKRPEPPIPKLSMLRSQVEKDGDLAAQEQKLLAADLAEIIMESAEPGDAVALAKMLMARPECLSSVATTITNAISNVTAIRGEIAGPMTGSAAETQSDGEAQRALPPITAGGGQGPYHEGLADAVMVSTEWRESREEPSEEIDSAGFDFGVFGARTFKGFGIGILLALLLALKDYQSSGNISLAAFIVLAVVIVVVCVCYVVISYMLEEDDSSNPLGPWWFCVPFFFIGIPWSLFSFWSLYVGPFSLISALAGPAGIVGGLMPFVALVLGLLDRVFRWIWSKWYG